MINKTAITTFGFPSTISDFKPKFYFEDQLTNDKFIGTGCHCRPDSVKFFVHSLQIGESIFTMDFYIRERPGIAGPHIMGPHIRLQHIATAPTFRNRGIATFYLKQLCDFCLENGLQTITINVAPDSTKGLDEKELFDFYNEFSSDKLKVIPF